MGVNCKRRKRNEGRKKIVFTQKWIGDAVKKFLQEEDIYESDMERIKYMRIGDCDFGGDYTIEMSTATLPDPLMEQKRLLREEFRRKMNRDNVNLAERLITQAKKAAELIKDEISVLCYEKLCSTITICQNYVKGETDLSWIDVYDEIYHGEGEDEEEDGIYLMSQYIDIPDEVALLMTSADDFSGFDQQHHRPPHFVFHSGKLCHFFGRLSFLNVFKSKSCIYHSHENLCQSMVLF